MKFSTPEALRGVRLDSFPPPLLSSPLPLTLPTSSSQLRSARRRAASASSGLRRARRSANGSVTRRAQRRVPCGCTDGSGDARSVTDAHKAAQRRRRVCESPFFAGKDAKVSALQNFWTLCTVFFFFYCDIFSSSIHRISLAAAAALVSVVFFA